ncbi:MAG TPA: bifunctional 2-polyprenyl-6-hydroxyphenol methylase/3-demethylubiquinol 3-O-methyltransferase UbiG [Rhabdochlamydiaceae bacterium]|nr:bifunctional 2-polyprenyl-6-hydroxyphenol methylase/3-demethylubiquinol 3-O-methyltransferase UbiG [Rhabdochlamydiaceae bacterium]
MERKKHLPINNAFYDDLDEMWNDSHDHPIALLRAENALRNPWIEKVVNEKFGRSCSILDIGCGGGFLTNYLAKKGHRVSGVDLSEKSLSIAKKSDTTQSAEYFLASAYELPFPEESFDVVSAMDLLEHVEKPELVIKEASRVLKKGGLFFFHTFNRNWTSYFIVIKGVEWCFSNTPRNMHIYPLFLKPKELEAMCNEHQMNVEKFLGLRPDFNSVSFWKMVFTRKVDTQFRFIFTPSLKTSYSGYAQKV